MHDDEENKGLVKLATYNTKLVFQGYANAEEVGRNLSNNFNENIRQIRMEYEN